MRNVPTVTMLGLTLLASGGALSCDGDSAAPSESRVPVVGDGPSTQTAGGAAIVVNNTAELISALSPENAGQRIHVRAGAYAVAAPLTVPDGVTLEGEGVMRYDGAGLPTGFAPGTGTTLSMTANVPGAVLTLGDGVIIRGLEIADLTGRSGNVVAVVSRDAGDRVSATILESEIINPNPLGASIEGPTGYGLLVLTRNPNLGADPLPHEDAELAARMVRSLIRSPAGGGLAAFNFAPRGSVRVTVEGNVVGGGISANGGVSRPDAVHDSEVRIDSRRNLYLEDGGDPCASQRSGWNLTGGSGPPAPLPVPETARNTLWVHSVDDRIEGFTIGILATGARRFFPSPIAGPSSGNRIEMELLGGGISTPACGGAPFVADLNLAGAFSADDGLVPGDGNSLRAAVSGVTGSGPRFNRYAHAAGPSGSLPVATEGRDNRLEITGSPEAFARTNRRIDPAPEADHFIGVAP